MMAPITGAGDGTITLGRRAQFSEKLSVRCFGFSDF
jgi:hypothetical protein